MREPGSLAENVNGHRRLFNALQAATVLLNGMTGALHLTGACLAPQLRDQFVELADPCRSQRMALGFEATRRIDGNAAADRELAALRSEARLSDVLLSLHLVGVVSLADRVTMTSAVQDCLAHELRHLELDADGLTARPTAEDVAQIDVQGALAGATATLQARATGSGSDAQIAAAALERLYVEAMRFDAEVAR